MTGNNAVEGAISILANTMRLYAEAHIRFGELFEVDREEAINNLDRALEAKLEAFHGLYDVSKEIFQYFNHGDTALIIAVRNAIHHRDHPLFRSLFSRLFLEDDPARWRGASFLLATYPTRHGVPIRMSHYFKLHDFSARLDPRLASPYLEAPRKENRARQKFILIERQLGFAVIRQKGANERYPEDQIYLDLIPIFTSAICRVFRGMKAAGIAFKGYDAETYMGPFTLEIDVDLGSPVFTMSRVIG